MEKKAIGNASSDDDVLEQLGYTQELKRNFGLLGMVGFSFSIVSSWTAVSGVLIIGVESGGPPVMIWGWLAVCLVTLTVAYSMAEMCSAYPVAGGQYSWVAILAPSRYARGLSYVCGWFMLIGIICMGAVNNFVAANFILGTAQLNYGFTIERYHTVLVAYLITIVAVVSNIYLPHILNKLSKAILCWSLLSFFVCLITILTTNKNKQSASYVFTDFQNFTGWGASYATALALLQSAFGMCCYDAPSHMTEEIKDARKQAPRAIIMSVYIGFFTGFIWLIALCFCIGDLETTGATPTGVPVIEIIYHSTKSIAGASTLTSMISIITLVAANSLMAEGSRAVYAFARDQGLPFSNTLSKVSSRSVPVHALLLVAVVQAAFNSIYFGTSTGFNTIIAIATQGFYLSYLMPLLSRILAHFSGKKTRLEGSYSLGRWGIVLNIIGFLFLGFICVIANLPSVTPVTSENMNYTSAATAFVMLIAAIFWITTGRKTFTGPDDGNLLDVGRHVG
ncbi:GABA permease [Dothidotthia symphoricarpi CBS 119687]|uniref:GABA permease n=1 Tax=Dothidotthia symphoricarpi CBS 119687 TaxID=1392245 RepID=A0A6A6AV13_9PLEO|nr:GABA permease [Dothidotthia symphoricarpi CBS 119687]KAF2134784.1 GABA permease [Dothidotthia symphoricarpi CBS 119687]